MGEPFIHIPIPIVECKLQITEDDFKGFTQELGNVTGLAIRTLAGFAMGFVEGACVGACISFTIIVISFSLINPPLYFAFVLEFGLLFEPLFELLLMITLLFIAFTVGLSAATVGIYNGVLAASAVFDNEKLHNNFPLWLPDSLFLPKS